MDEIVELPGADDALLADGTTVHIRPIGGQDRAAVLRLHENMSDENRRLRFFGVARGAPGQTADRLCGAARPGLLALGAFRGTDLLGVAEYSVDARSPDTAELAIAVADTRHGHGVGTLLVEHLAHAARKHGVTAFTAEALADNHAVHRLFADLGLRLDRRIDQGEVHLLIADLPQLAEARIVVGSGATAPHRARLRLAPTTAHDPYLRRLRRLPEPAVRA